jgi:hypothetical protein
MATTVHTHETTDEGETIALNGVRTLTGSVAGTVPSLNFVFVTLTGHCFFPMLYGGVAGAAFPAVTGHATDASDPDAARLGFRGGSSSTPYAVDYRYMDL